MELAEQWNVPPWEISQANAADLFEALDVARIRDTFARQKDQPKPRLN